jgi:hypothetical protein
MNQAGVAVLEGIRRVSEIVGRHSLEHGRRARSRVDAGGQRHESVGRYDVVGRVRARDAGPRDAVTGADRGHSVPHCLDDARPLEPERDR